MLIIEPVHIPPAGGIEREEIVRELLPFDLGKRIQLRLKVGLLPGTDVKDVVKAPGAKDDTLKGAFFHFGDVIFCKIRIGDVPSILDDFLFWTLPGEDIHRNK